MDYLNNTINTLPRERGQHLRFEDRCEIKVLHKQGYSYRQIAKALNCSPSTVGYELKRGTATKTTQLRRHIEADQQSMYLVEVKPFTMKTEDVLVVNSALRLKVHLLFGLQRKLKKLTGH